MWKLSLPLLLLAAPPVFAQLENHTLTMTATRSTNLQPDQVVFGLSVASGAAATLDQIVAALGLGVTSANLTGVSTYSAIPLQWNFTLAVPLANLAATIGSLTKLQQTIVQNNSGLTLTFIVNGTQVSQQLQSQSCSNSDLIADATAQAQKLVAAAGLTLGPIARLSNVPLPESSIPQLTAAVARVGGIIQTGAAFAELSLAPAPSPVTCTLVVKFQLLP
jgi:uncharacterized protein YggE